jgi:hypothetical protein
MPLVVRVIGLVVSSGTVSGMVWWGQSLTRRNLYERPLSTQSGHSAYAFLKFLNAQVTNFGWIVLESSRCMQSSSGALPNETMG